MQQSQDQIRALQLENQLLTEKLNEYERQIPHPNVILILSGQQFQQHSAQLPGSFSNATLPDSAPLNLLNRLAVKYLDLID